MNRKAVCSALVLAIALPAALVAAQPRRTIQADEAIRIALKRVPGVVEEVERDYERGRPVFEVEIISEQGPKYEVLVDAESGEILDARPDD